MSRENKILRALFILLIINLGLIYYVQARPESVAAPPSPEEAEEAVEPVEGITETEEEIEEVEADEPKIQITFLDIGQGDASYLAFPNGEDMLVDCSKDARVLAALGRTMRWLDREIDYLVVTHPDMDHYGGCIDVLKRYRVKNIIYNGGKKEYDQVWRSFWEAVETEQAVYKEVAAEETVEIAGATIHFLYPDKPAAEIPGDVETNNKSIIFTLRYGKGSILFTGDAEKELEEYLLQKYGAELDVDVLKVGHHGSPSSSIQPFVDRVMPEHAMISVGTENTYRHPSLRVVRRLERAGARVWRTDTEGDILLYMTPAQLTVTNISR